MFLTIALILFGISLCFVLSSIERELTHKHKEQESDVKAHEELVKLKQQLLPSNPSEGSDSESDAALKEQERQLKEHKSNLTSAQQEFDRLNEKVKAYRFALLFLVSAILALILGLIYSLTSLILSPNFYWLATALSITVLSAALLWLFRGASTRRKVTSVIVGGTLLASILAGARALARISVNPSINLEAKIDAALNGYFSRQSTLGPEHIASINSFFSGRRCPTKEKKACDSPEVQNKLNDIFNRVCDEKYKNKHPGPPQWIVIIGSTDRVPLRGEAKATFESNFGLARARAEWIKAKWFDWKANVPKTQTRDCQIPNENFITIGAGPRDTGELVPANTGRGHSLANDDDRGIDIWALWPSPGKSPEKALDISIKVSDIELKKKVPLPKAGFGFGTKKPNR